MANETAGLLGRKLGMTQIYNSEDMMVPVTVIEVSVPSVGIQLVSSSRKARTPT